MFTMGQDGVYSFDHISRPDPFKLSKKDRTWTVCYTPVPGCSDGTLCKSVTLAH